MRARELSIELGGLPCGLFNAITDVPGVLVGHTTLTEGESVRTGVTVVLPHHGDMGADPLFAGCHRINGNGELTGLEWVRESGMLSSPIAITNTFSVGVVRDALCSTGRTGGLPVVGETWDGDLNDIHGMHISADHLHSAVASAATGPVQEGNVGGGTGMICHEFKGGIGTSSRVVAQADCIVGVLVQANHGRRERFRVMGLPVGERLTEDRVPLPTSERTWPPGSSIIIVVATDAPLLPHQCDRLAARTAFGVARTGGVGENSSGDLAIAFSTGNRGLLEDSPSISLEMLPDEHINHLFDAVIDATEEAIVNAVLGAETMTGHRGATATALAPELLREALAELRP
ncbi:MAG: P1 family peptidase [Actinomycetota bacterium]|nr:P1 family peptidase [Actinomycetota bacterium]